jgi:hypothetical protein
VTEAIYSLRTGGSTKLAPGRLRAGEAPQARPCCLLISAPVRHHVLALTGAIDSMPCGWRHAHGP